MRRIYKIVIVIFCVSLYVISSNKVVYAKNNNIDYDSVSKELEWDIEENHISGLFVIVVSPDEVIFSKTYGNCNNIDTPFIIGSMNNMKEDKIKEAEKIIKEMNKMKENKNKFKMKKKIIIILSLIAILIAGTTFFVSKQLQQKEENKTVIENKVEEEQPKEEEQKVEEEKEIEKEQEEEKVEENKEEQPKETVKEPVKEQSKQETSKKPATTTTQPQPKPAEPVQQEQPKQDPNKYYKKLPFGEIVSEEEAKNNTAIITKQDNFFYYISKIDTLDGEIVNIEWKIFSEKRQSDYTLEQAKKYVKAPPTSLEESIKLYNQNPNIHYGNVTLLYVAGIIYE